MGISTNAILYYGLDIDLDGGAPQKLIVLQPEGFDENECEELEQMLMDANEKLGLKLVFGIHGSDACLAHYIAYHQFEARRGYPKKILTQIMQASTVEWDAEIKSFCEATGLPFSTPGWRLASWWG